MTRLLIFGPGGPHLPMREWAQKFSKRSSVEAEVIKGTPFSWAERVRREGDLIYMGAEYMLADFDRDYPGIIDPGTVTNLYPRAVGIMVRKGNPKGITCLKDLGGPDQRILDVELENMRETQERAGIQGERLYKSVLTGQDGVDAWLTDPSIDAWITYESWHVTLEDRSEFLSLESEGVAPRYTPIAVVKGTEHRQEALAFIRSLKSEEGHRVFRKRGWQ